MNEPGLMNNINGWTSKESFPDELRLSDAHESDTLPMTRTIDKGVKIIVELTENCTSGDKAHLVKKGRAEVTFAHRAKGKSAQL